MHISMATSRYIRISFDGREIRHLGERTTHVHVDTSRPGTFLVIRAATEEDLLTASDRCLKVSRQNRSDSEHPFVTIPPRLHKATDLSPFKHEPVDRGLAPDGVILVGYPSAASPQIGFKRRRKGGQQAQDEEEVTRSADPIGAALKRLHNAIDEVKAGGAEVSIGVNGLRVWVATRHTGN